MFNPLVDSFENLSDAEVDEGVRTLSRRYFQTNNAQLQQQVSVILEMYKQEMRSRIAKAQQTQTQDDNNSLDNLINVS